MPRPLQSLQVGLAFLLAGFGCSNSTPTDSPPAAGGAAGRSSISTPAGATSAVASDKNAQDATPDELVNQALEAVAQDQSTRALTLVNLALDKDSKHRESMMLKGALLYGEAQKVSSRDRAAGAPLLGEAAGAMRSLRAEYPDLRPQEQNLLIYTLYDEARTLAAADQPEKAVAVLSEAVEAGLDVPAALENEELASLADRDDFKALKDTLKRKATENLKAEIAAFEPFPISFELPTVSGETATLDQLRGKTLTIVDVWGTWCPPCKMEIPHFIELYEKYKDEGLQIVGVTYENTDDVDSARKVIQSFLEETPIPYPLVITDGRFIEQVPDFQGFPTTLFLDAQGQVRLKLVGYHAMEDLETIIGALMNPDSEGQESE